jgi:orotate phosphoribosyltransferase
MNNQFNPLMLSEPDVQEIAKTLFKHIDEQCIFRADPSVSYSKAAPLGLLVPSFPSSKFNKWTFMLRRLTQHPVMVNLAARLFADRIARDIEAGTIKVPFQFCGLETSSIALVTAIQQHFLFTANLAVNSFVVRKHRKNYGLFHLIDGMVTEAPVIVIDDVINSGSSIRQALQVCKSELNLKPAGVCYSVVRFDEIVGKYITEDQLTATSLFTTGQFDMSFDKTKYWLPDDCNRQYAKSSNAM